MAGLFRNWQHSPKSKDPEIEKLERQAEETRKKIAELREQGRTRRDHRLQSLDALETRRMTLTEIMRRMEKELADKDVDDYADILAEVFGERTVFAHRAVGLEALLCQFMHQMLAKQHQLKIIKKWGKDMQKQYQKFKLQNKNEFHSFEALAVHCETMRLSLEAQYDDVFASQHALLAQFHKVEAGDNMTSYKVIKPSTEDAPQNGSTKAKLTVSTKHEVTPADLRSPSNKLVDSVVLADDNTLMEEILLDPNNKKQSSNHADPEPSSPSPSTPTKNGTLSSPTSRRSGSGQKSARDRRREIEQKRLATGRSSTTTHNNPFEEPDKDKARERMRELEAQKKSISSRANSHDSSDSELKVRGARRSSRRSKYGNNDDELSRSSKESTSHRRVKKTQSTDSSLASDEEARRRRREKRRQERAAKSASSQKG